MDQLSWLLLLVITVQIADARSASSFEKEEEAGCMQQDNRGSSMATR